MTRNLVWSALILSALLVSRASAGHHDHLDRIRIEGRIESIRGQIALIHDDYGHHYRVQLGPQWYWDERNYYLRSGWYVNVVAWYDSYEDCYYAGEIRGRDFCYDLCDSRGYPRWRNYDDCYDGWRPTRSFFQICFVIGDPHWSCSRHAHFHDCFDNCGYRHTRHRDWHSNDRDHHGRHRDRDWDDNDHRRGGRRDNDNGGYERRFTDNGNRSTPPAGGNYNSQVELPRKSSSAPDKKVAERSYSVEKPKSSKKSSSDSNGKSYSSQSSKKMEKVRPNSGHGKAKANTKSSRKVDFSTKSRSSK